MSTNPNLHGHHGKGTALPYPKSRDDWEEQRRNIEQIYVVEDKPLHQLRVDMKKTYGFEATERQYKRRISDWHLDKNVKSDEMKAIVYAQYEGEALGQACEFFVRGKRVDPKKIARFIGRMKGADKAAAERCRTLCISSHRNTRSTGSSSGVLPPHITSRPFEEGLVSPQIPSAGTTQSGKDANQGNATTNNRYKDNIGRKRQRLSSATASSNRSTSPSPIAYDEEAIWSGWYADVVGCTVGMLQLKETSSVQPPGSEQADAADIFERNRRFEAHRKGHVLDPLDLTRPNSHNGNLQYTAENSVSPTPPDYEDMDIDISSSATSRDTSPKPKGKDACKPGGRLPARQECFSSFCDNPRFVKAI